MNSRHWRIARRLFSCCVLASMPAIAMADCSPDQPDDPMTPGDQGLPTSNSIVVCTGVDTDGFKRPFDVGNPFNNRDELTVQVLGTVSSNVFTAIVLEGDSHTVIVDDDGEIIGRALIEGHAPGFSMLGNGTAGTLTAIGDNAFLNVADLSGTNTINIEGNDSNSTISGGLVTDLNILGDRATFDMSGGFIAGNLTVAGIEPTLTISGGVNTNVEVVGVDANLTITGGAFNDMIRVEGTDSITTIDAGTISDTVLIAGQNANLTNQTTISGGVTLSGDGLVDNFGGIEGIGVFMTEQGGRLLNRSGATIATTGPGDDAVFGTNSGLDVDNRGTLSTEGDAAYGILLEGNNATVNNRTGSTISTMGGGSGGILIDGDGGTLTNASGVTTGGQLSAGLGVFGLNGLLDNDGDVTTQAATSFGLLLATARDDTAPGGPRAPALTNSAKITTSGAFSSGMVGLGTELSIINEAGGQIATDGDDAHGIAMGFQTAPPLPADISAALNVDIPAEGDVTNDGVITTTGLDADGIHVFAAGTAADKTMIINNNGVTTSGLGADGIDAVGDHTTIDQRDVVDVGGALARAVSIAGDNATILNTGAVTTTLTGSEGLVVKGVGAMIVNGNSSTQNDSEGVITTAGANAHGIVLGRQNDGVPSRGDIINAGNLTTTGDGADGIQGFVELTAIENERNITVEGDNAYAINITGPDPKQSATRSAVVNHDVIVGGLALLGIPVSSNSGGIRFGGRVSVDNRIDASITALGDNARAIVGGENVAADDAAVRNLGTVVVDGNNGRGIDIRGIDVSVMSGRFLPTSIADTAKIEVVGVNGIGIRTSGAGTTINNSVLLSVDGADSIALLAEFDAAGGVWIDNDATIRVNGDRSVGMEIRSNLPNVNLFLPFADKPNETFCAGGGPAPGAPAAAAILNCGTINLNGATAATGMLVTGIADTFIENQADIIGAADGLKGMVLNEVTGAAPSDAGFNFISNFDEILLTGPDARGVVINGAGNFINNGTGNSAIDLDPTDDQDFGVFLSTMLDRSTARGILGIGSDLETTTTINSKGIVHVDGTNSIAMELTGNSNWVSNRWDQVIEDCTPEDECDDLKSTNVFSEIVASGTGSIGVKLSGDDAQSGGGNVIENQGIIRGEAFAILGGIGRDSVVNRYRIEGDVSLGAADDAVVFDDGAVFTGIVDGGSGTDLLRIANSDFLGPSATIPPAPVVIANMDGDQFVNFETFEMELLDILNLSNRLSVVTADLNKGLLLLVDATLEANNVTIGPLALLGGNGVVTVTPDAQSGQIVGKVELLPGGGIKIGNSPGLLTVNGDIDLGGLLEIEMEGLTSDEFDQLVVNGDAVFLDGAGIDFVFSNGFAPKAGDIFDFLVADSILGDPTLVEYAVFGLQEGFLFDVSINSDGLRMTALNDGVAIPLPSAILMFLGGLLSAGWFGRRRQTGCGR